MQSLQQLESKIVDECRDVLESAAKSVNALQLCEQQKALQDVLEKIRILQYLESYQSQHGETSAWEQRIEVPEFTDAHFEEETAPIADEIHAENPVEEKIPENSFDHAESAIAVHSGSVSDIQAETETIQKVEEEQIQTAENAEVYDELVENSEENIMAEGEQEAAGNQPNAADEPQTFAETNLAAAAEKKLKIPTLRSVQPQSSEPATGAPMSKHHVERGNTSNAHPTEFKLDLNDRIAFTRTLFGNSQSDLNSAIQRLNACKNPDEAKEFLSDLYYEKGWQKHEEFAQRLWSLVENRFS